MKASALQELSTELTRRCNVTLYLKRDDQLDTEIVGNKWRKLLPHINPFQSGNFKRVVTMGGAHSNHVLSTSYLTPRFAIPTVAYIRGDELDESANDVLLQSHANGMDLRFISRSEYRERRQADIENTVGSNSADYWLPEGGMSALSKDGCKEIVREIDLPFDWLFCSCGTGTTISGIAQAAMTMQPSAKLVGVCALLPSSMIRNNIAELCGGFPENLSLSEDFATRYGKATQSIASVMQRYHSELDIQLDFNYTGKMMECVEHHIENGIVRPSEVVVAIHTGGQETAGLKYLG